MRWVKCPVCKKNEGYNPEPAAHSYFQQDYYACNSCHHPVAYEYIRRHEIAGNIMGWFLAICVGLPIVTWLWGGIGITFDFIDANDKPFDTNGWEEYVLALVGIGLPLFVGLRKWARNPSI